MSAIQQLIMEIKNLTPIPAVVTQIMAAVDKPGASMQDIAEIVQYDPMLTANILRTCNSAFFGLKNPVESVKDAVAIMGMDQILELVMLKSVAPTMGKAQKGYGLEKGEIWRYSVSSALVAKGIAATHCPQDKNTIFTASLLKDIGKVVLDRFVAGSLDTISALVRDRGFTFKEAEKQVVGIDHAELGAMIGKMWKFSPKLVRIIRHHHLSEEAMRKDRDIAIVYLADCLCMMMGIGVGADGLAYRFHDSVIRDLGITANDFARIMADFTMEMQRVEELLKVVG
ncbi:MAG: HDOD domain-containing protein [Pseudomonadota bacterium]